MPSAAFDLLAVSRLACSVTRRAALTAALGFGLLAQTPAHAFTIDFSSFEPGPLPPTVATPWGDLAFPEGLVRDDPLHPGSGPRMAYGFSVADADLPGEVGPLTLMIPSGSLGFELIFELINLNPEPRSLEGLLLDAQGGDTGDFGIKLPAEGTSLYTERLFPDFDAGISFLGATDDLTESDRCYGTDSTCNDLWGILSIEINPVPEPSAAALLTIGLLGLAMRRRSLAR